jgi:hypothetical protein
MVIEEEKTIERELERCSWCGSIDREEKVYASPGDDIEHPKAYHKQCFEALRIYMILCMSYPEKTIKELVGMANESVGIKTKK